MVFNPQKCRSLENSVTLTQQTARWKKVLKGPLDPLVVTWDLMIRSTSISRWYQKVSTCERNDSLVLCALFGNEISTFSSSSHETLRVLCALLGHEINTYTANHVILKVLCALLGHEITTCFTASSMDPDWGRHTYGHMCSIGTWEHCMGYCKSLFDKNHSYHTNIFKY